MYLICLLFRALKIGSIRHFFSADSFRTAADVMEDLEKSLSDSLNRLFRLSVLAAVLLLTVRYLSQPRMMLPYMCVSSR